MSRPLRIDLPHGWYHVTARGLERRAIFKVDRDRVHFLELVGAVVERFGVVVHAYVLMDNHYHLMVETPAANLSQAMQWVNVSYSVWFNRRRGRVGPVFQGRFKAVVVEAEAYAVELSRYVHLNPVRVKQLGLAKATQRRQQAGLGTETPAGDVVKERVRRLRGYRWSSYRAYVGLERGREWLVTSRVLALLGGGTARAGREKYREFVEAAAREGLAENPWERLAAGLLLGGSEFVERMRQLAKGNMQQQPALRALQRRCGIADVIRCVEGMKGERWEGFCDRHGDWGRDVVLLLGRKLCGLKLRELAELVGAQNEATIALAVKRVAVLVEKDAALREWVSGVQQQLLNVKT